jgi:hypothetical protein
MLQAGGPRVRFPMRSLDFSIDLILPAALRSQCSTKPLTVISTKNFPGNKARPAFKADLTALSRLSRKCGSLDVSTTGYKG